MGKDQTESDNLTTKLQIRKGGRWGWQFYQFDPKHPDDDPWWDVGATHTPFVGEMMEAAYQLALAEGCGGQQKDVNWLDSIALDLAKVVRGDHSRHPGIQQGLKFRDCTRPECQKAMLVIARAPVPESQKSVPEPPPPPEPESDPGVTIYNT